MTKEEKIPENAIRWDLLRELIEEMKEGGLHGLVEKMAGSDKEMSREEAILRLLIDLPRC